MTCRPLRSDSEVYSENCQESDRLMEARAGISRLRSTARRRRWSEHPASLISTLSVDHDESEPLPIGDEADDRRRQDGATVAVGPQNATLLDPDETIGTDQFSYPESQAQRSERLKPRRLSSYDESEQGR